VRIEDLLRREPVQIDTVAVAALLRGKRVLVTGGGGFVLSEAEGPKEWRPPNPPP